MDKIRKELFEKELGSTHCIGFQVAALQATNASALDRNTLHSAFGIGVIKTKEPKAAGDASADAQNNSKKDKAAQRIGGL